MKKRYKINDILQIGEYRNRGLSFFQSIKMLVSMIMFRCELAKNARSSMKFHWRCANEIMNSERDFHIQAKSLFKYDTKWSCDKKMIDMIVLLLGAYISAFVHLYNGIEKITRFTAPKVNK